VLVYEMIVGTAPFGYSSAGRAKRPETSGTLSRGVVEEKDEAKVEHVCSATETDARRAADSQEPGSSELERAILSGVSAVEWPDEVFSDEAEGRAALDFIQCVRCAGNAGAVVDQASVCCLQEASGGR